MSEQFMRHHSETRTITEMWQMDQGRRPRNVGWPVNV